MYHFVGDRENTRFADIKGLGVDEFRGQLSYIQGHYNVIGWPVLKAALYETDRGLPPRSLLLTFDDGYRDHVDNVLPILIERGLAGCFFPPAKAVTRHEVLDVNKIHFILAAEPSASRLITSLFDLIDEAREEFVLESREFYWRKLAHPNRFDSAEIIFVKRMLQRELPEVLRSRITDALFQKYVTHDEAAFSQELYMSPSDLRVMMEAGMHVGSHGFDHYWLDTIDERNQEREVGLSLDFLGTLGVDADDWTMCYPYGAYNASLLTILRREGCRAGFTTEVRLADIARDDPLTLPRIDTNDLPRHGDAAPSEWTTCALNEEAGK
jgi:peptidoglycan/xylan/chitin deacetylase (PgdA/CDA1 family)